MPLHPQTEKFRELLALWGEAIGGDTSIEGLRRAQQDNAPYRGNGPDLPEVTDLDVAGIPVRLYRPEPRSTGPLPALVYFHGGGWVLGDIATVDGACRDLAAGAGCVVVNVGYRLAPEHPFPAGLDDAWAVTLDVVRNGERYGTDGRAAVAGDSAGGNLAAVVAVLARDHGVRLAHQALVYPVTDTGMDTASWEAYAAGYGLDAVTMAAYLAYYRAGADPADPRIAPLRAADLSGVAPATIVGAECDILCDEGRAYAGRLAAAGVPVDHRCFDGIVHGFFLLPEIFDAAVEARELIVRRLRAAFEEEQ